MRVVLFLLMLSVAAWAGDKQKGITGKPKPSSKVEDHLTKSQIESSYGVTFVKDDVVLLGVAGHIFMFAAWRFELAGPFPGGTIPFYVPVDPTNTQVAAALLSSAGTLEAYGNLDSKKPDQKPKTDDKGKVPIIF